MESACRVFGAGDSQSDTLTGAELGLVKVPDTDAIIRAIIHSKVNRRLTFNIIDLAEQAGSAPRRTNLRTKR